MPLCCDMLAVPLCHGGADHACFCWISQVIQAYGEDNVLSGHSNWLLGRSAVLRAFAHADEDVGAAATAANKFIQVAVLTLLRQLSIMLCWFL